MAEKLTPDQIAAQAALEDARASLKRYSEQAAAERQQAQQFRQQAAEAQRKADQAKAKINPETGRPFAGRSRTADSNRAEKAYRSSAELARKQAEAAEGRALTADNQARDAESRTAAARQSIRSTSEVANKRSDDSRARQDAEGQRKLNAYYIGSGAGAALIGVNAWLSTRAARDAVKSLVENLPKVDPKTAAGRDALAKVKATVESIKQSKLLDASGAPAQKTVRSIAGKAAGPLATAGGLAITSQIFKAWAKAEKASDNETFASWLETIATAEQVAATTISIKEGATATASAIKGGPVLSDKQLATINRAADTLKNAKASRKVSDGVVRARQEAKVAKRQAAEAQRHAKQIATEAKRQTAAAEKARRAAERDAKRTEQQVRSEVKAEQAKAKRAAAAEKAQQTRQQRKIEAAHRAGVQQGVKAERARASGRRGTAVAAAQVKTEALPKARIVSPKPPAMPATPAAAGRTVTTIGSIARAATKGRAGLALAIAAAGVSLLQSRNPAQAAEAKTAYRKSDGTSTLGTPAQIAQWQRRKGKR